MKRILFVINTMGHAGAEAALLEVLRRLDGSDYEIYLYVIMGQGEMIRYVPSYVNILNSDFDEQPVLTGAGRRRMVVKVITACFRNGRLLRKLRSIVRNVRCMIKKKDFQPDKLVWRVMSDGAERFDIFFDLAVAWLEGGSAYYVADYVKARKKAAFIHIDYESAGYTREMDQGCFAEFDRIFAVSDEARKHFTAFYPEYTEKTGVIHNLINREGIIEKSKEAGGFSDDFNGVRLLSVGRLKWQKAYDIAVKAMKLLKEEGCPVRWYVLGEGDQRKNLEKKIRQLGLEEDFLLLGAKENPYPYYAQTDLYVHATRFEGKSIAIQEAQILGCAIIASDCNGNREQIDNGVDGILCELTPAAIAASIRELCRDREKRERLAKAAEMKSAEDGRELQMLLKLAGEDKGI